MNGSPVEGSTRRVGSFQLARRERGAGDGGREDAQPFGTREPLMATGVLYQNLTEVVFFLPLDSVLKYSSLLPMFE